MILEGRKEISLIWKLAVSFLICCLIMLVLPMKARAAEATICHQHTSDCYQQKAVTCSDKNVVTTHNEEFNCATCGRISSARVVVETYTCEYSDYQREYRRIAYCYGCGGIVQNKQTSAVPTHVRIARVCVCPMTEETVIAKVNFTASTSVWTNEDVVLSAAVTEPASGQSLAPYTYGFSGDDVGNGSWSVGENGSYSVTVTASNGQQTTASLQVNNIDKENPKITECYVDKSYPEYSSANLIVVAEDGLSGLAEKPYSFDGGKTFVGSNSYPVFANGNYTVYVKDCAGNCSTQTIGVTCFAAKTEFTKPSANTSISDGKTQNGVAGVDNSTGSTITGKASGTKQSQEETTQHSEMSTEKEIAEEERRALMKEKLEQCDSHVSLNEIPGVYSSLMKQNAEKNAVPMTLNVVNEKNETAYSNTGALEENLVKNISINGEKEQPYGTFAQVSKGIVAIGVLLCIGMMGFLIVFLVKKQ